MNYLLIYILLVLNCESWVPNISLLGRSGSACVINIPVSLYSNAFTPTSSRVLNVYGKYTSVRETRLLLTSSTSSSSSSSTTSIKSFVNGPLRNAAMILHTKDQAPKEGKQPR